MIKKIERKIEMEWPELGVKVLATLADNKNHDICDVFWDNLPFESIQSHAIVSGSALSIPHNIFSFVKPEYVEDYTDSKSWGKYRYPPGVIRINTTTDFVMAVWYDSDRYEPGKLAPIAFVDGEYLEKLREVGEMQFKGTMRTPQKCYKVIIRRKG